MVHLRYWPAVLRLFVLDDCCVSGSMATNAVSSSSPFICHILCRNAFYHCSAIDRAALCAVRIVCVCQFYMHTFLLLQSSLAIFIPSTGTGGIGYSQKRRKNGEKTKKKMIADLDSFQNQREKEREEMRNRCFALPKKNDTNRTFCCGDESNVIWSNMSFDIKHSLAGICLFFSSMRNAFAFVLGIFHSFENDIDDDEHD